MKAKYKIWKGKQTKPLNTILIQFQLFIFYETRLFTEKFSQTTTIHPGIFGGRALWAVSINLPAFYHEYRPLIGYATHVLLCDR